MKRRTVERGPEEEEIPVVRVRGKVLRKIGEKEVF